jgi:phenylalanyl-tRNA synthetase beta chain
MPTIRVPVSWLKEYADARGSVEDIARQLHMSGTEVDRIERPGGGWEHVWVGRIAALEKHPNADKLQLATVDYGDGRRKTVVTGAPNIAVGDVVPYAEVGATLREGHGDGVRTLEPKRVRGIMSDGMVCSAKELGLGEDHEGILILDKGMTVGQPLADALGDPVLVLELQPNRPDCMGVVGVARPKDAGRADRRPGRLPAFRSRVPRAREDRSITAVDAGPARRRGDAPDPQRGRHHQLRDARAWAAVARV